MGVVGGCGFFLRWFGFFCVFCVLGFWESLCLWEVVGDFGCVGILVGSVYLG